MNREQHILIRAGEECNEVGQRISKALVFGLEQVQQARDDAPWQNPHKLTNRTRIISEFYDLVALMKMAGLITVQTEEQPGTGVASLHSYVVVPTDAISAKEAKVERYLKLSAECGTLTGEPCVYVCSSCGRPINGTGGTLPDYACPECDAVDSWRVAP